MALVRQIESDERTSGIPFGESGIRQGYAQLMHDVSTYKHKIFAGSYQADINWVFPGTQAGTRNLLMGDSTGTLNWATLIASTGISITYANSQITLTATGGVAPEAHASTHVEGGADPIIGNINLSSGYIKTLNGYYIGATQVIDASRNLLNIGTVTSGLINSQTISSTANFTGTIGVTGIITAAANGHSFGNTTVGTLSSGAITASGTINANATATNIRLKANGTTALDGFVGATGPGVLYFSNWDADRGWRINVDGTITQLGSAGITVNALSSGAITAGADDNVLVSNTTNATFARTLLAMKRSGTAHWGLNLQSSGTNDLALYSYGTASNILTFARATGNVTFSGSLTVAGDAAINGGNITSTASNIIFDKSLLPATTDAYNLGSYTKLWSSSYISTMNALIFAENVIQVVGGRMKMGKNQGKLPAVGSADVTIDFGQAMTVGDFIEIRAHDTSGTIKAEYILIGNLVSGTTYNVTRDLASAHVTDPAWADGTIYFVLGQTGTGRIEFDAESTPRISMFTQGATYGANTEKLRVGDLNGNWGYETEIYGFAAGTYAASNSWVTIDGTNGFRVGNNTTVLGQWDASGNLILGEVATSKANLYISTGVAYFRVNTTSLVSIGANVAYGGISGIVINNGMVESVSNSNAWVGVYSHGSGNDAISLWGTCNGAGTQNIAIRGEALGAGTTNYGLHATASGATTNWAGYFDDGNVLIKNYLRVGGLADNTTVAFGIKFGLSEDTVLYRSAVNTLTTDDDFVAATLKTGDPGAGAGKWRLGTVGGGAAPSLTTNSLKVEVDGTDYEIGLITRV